LIVGCALVPFLLAGGLVGAFAPSMALAFGVAALVSIVVALTVAPALCMVLRTNPGELQRGSALGRRLRLEYSNVLTRVLHRTRSAFIVVAAAGIVFVVVFGALVVPRVAESPLPAFRDPGLLVRWDAAQGTSGPEMDRIVSKVTQEMRAIPGVRDVGAHVGRAILSDQVVGINSGELWLGLDPSADYDATVAAIVRVANAYPGFSTNVGTYASERVSSILPPARSDLVVRVYGQELSVLQQQAKAVRQAVTDVPQVASAEIQGQTLEPTLKIQVDLAAADRVGLKPGDIRRSATTLLSGIVVGSLFENQKVFEVVVWSTPETRKDLAAINDLAIDRQPGGHVRLGDVASVTLGPSPTVIRREGVFRYVDVRVDLQGGDIVAAARNINTAVKSLAMPLEYRAEVLGDYSERLAEQSLLIAAIVAAALAIFLLLQAAFQSWRLAALIFLTLPAAILGGALTAIVGDGLSLGTILGFVTVLAITTRNGILLVRTFQRLEQGGDVRGRALVLHAASDRLVPLLATVGATMIAFVPFVILGDRPGYEVIRPMAIVILGGLVTATLLVLFLVPTLYQRVVSSPQGDTAPQLTTEPALGPTTA
jgi:Cu/Ag efflux pump CusA